LKAIAKERQDYRIKLNLTPNSNDKIRKFMTEKEIKGTISSCILDPYVLDLLDPDPDPSLFCTEPDLDPDSAASINKQKKK
jgi:hypothetical protein